jgi:hypothetical protein
MNKAIVGVLCIFLSFFGHANAESACDADCRERIRQGEREREGRRQDEEGQAQLPVGHIISRNYGSCSFGLLIAYVPRGANEYIVDGWWQTGPMDWGTIQDENKRMLVHDGQYPLFYYAKKANGESVKNLSKDRSFDFQGQSYLMTKLSTGLHEGGYWIEIVC